MQARALLLPICFVIGLASQSQAAPILLAQLHVTHGGAIGGLGSYRNVELSGGAHFGLGYSLDPPTHSDYGRQYGPEIGGAKAWAPGSSGVFDFTRSNSTGFDDLVASLTDGADSTFYDFISVGLRATGYANPYVSISLSRGWGAPESVRFGGSADLPGTVDFIRFSLSSLALGTYADPFLYRPNYNSMVVRYEFSGTWQIYGTPMTASEAVVPEPGSLVLLCVGLAGMRAWRRRR